MPTWMREDLVRQFDPVLDVMVFDRCVEYGGKALAEVVRFEPKHSLLVREAATRLERGDSP